MHRSFLMVPAVKLSGYWQHPCRSADASLPDYVVIDLEDSVTPSRKAEAVSAVRRALWQASRSIPAIQQAWEAHLDIGRADRIQEQFRTEPTVLSFVDDQSGNYIGTPSLARHES